MSKPGTVKDLVHHERVISNFDDFQGENPHAFLSNFWVEPVVCVGYAPAPGGPLQRTTEGLVWPTGEHLFAALKASRPREYTDVWQASGPSSAKRIGRRLPLRGDWEAVKYDVMVYVVQQKFAPGTHLAQRLKNTDASMLVEGTEWADRVWGLDLNARYHPGRNWLGRTLMARRAELRLPGKVVRELDRSFQMAFWPRMERGVKDTWSS